MYVFMFYLILGDWDSVIKPQRLRILLVHRYYFTLIFSYGIYSADLFSKREIMRERLFETCGIAHLDLNLLLDAKQDDEFTDWRSYILTELEDFVVGTGRFTTHSN